MQNYRDIIESIISDYRAYSPENRDAGEIIMKAFDFASQAHDGQIRKSGDEYISHPLAATAELMTIHPDLTTILACLLHDCVDDGDADVSEIRDLFGEDVANIVHEIGHIGKIKYRGDKATVGRLQKTFVSMAVDVRVIFVKFADRIHNLKTLSHHETKKKADRVALESLMIYAPIASRLGLYHFKNLLEDLSFRWLNPESYAQITGELAHLTLELESFVTHSQEQIGEIIPDSIPYEITYRIKKPYSIYRKMQSLDVDRVENVYDVFAIRVLTDSVEHCYMILGVIHGKWKPVLENLKDHIGSPKPNGYQSLHTTILGLYDSNRKKPTEIQIRTFDMHDRAEYGSAAHFRYKEGTYKLDTDWIDNLGEKYLEHIRSGRYFEHIERQTCPVSIYVFTPKGDIKELPYGSCIIDFAYAIHTDVGHTTTGGRINQKIAPLNTKLSNGDVVEVITDNNAHPNEAWLGYVVTNKAKQQISIETKRLNGDRDKAVQKGKDLINAFLLREFGESLDDNLTALNMIDGAKMSEDKKEQLLYIVGSGKRRASSVFRDRLKIRSDNTERPIRQVEQRDEIRHVIVGGERHLDVHFAGCCRPSFPSSIIAVVRRDGTVSVHDSSCGGLDRTNPARQHEAYWETLDAKGKLIDLTIISTSRSRDVFADVTSLFYDLGINILEGKTHHLDQGIQMDFRLEVDKNDPDIRATIADELSENFGDITML